MEPLTDPVLDSQGAGSRQLVAAALTHQGQQADALLSPAAPGALALLRSLVDQCRSQPEDLWPEIIATHVAAQAQRQVAEPFEGLTSQQIQRGIYLRLQTLASLSDASLYSYARRVTPALVEVLVLQRRKESLLLTSAEVERLGGLDLLRPKGLANLRQIRVMHEATIDTPEGGAFRIVRGTSPFTASALLNPGRLLRWEYAEPSAPYGVLAAMPSDTEVALHIIRDSTASASLTGLANFARLRNRSASEPLSPHVFWAREDRLEQVTDWDSAGALRHIGGPEFSGLLLDLDRIGCIRPVGRYGPDYEDA